MSLCAEAQHTLGYLLFNAGGTDVESQTKVEAVKWLQKSVGQKFAPAFHSLAQCFILGLGGVARNHNTAAGLIVAGAEMGDASAQMALGWGLDA